MMVSIFCGGQKVLIQLKGWVIGPMIWLDEVRRVQFVVGLGWRCHQAGWKCIGEVSPTVRQTAIHLNGIEEEHWQSSHLVHLIRVFFFFVQLCLNVMAQPVLFRLFGFVKRFNSVEVKMTCVSESSTLEPTSSLQVMQWCDYGRWTICEVLLLYCSSRANWPLEWLALTFSRWQEETHDQLASNSYFSTGTVSSIS